MWRLFRILCDVFADGELTQAVPQTVIVRDSSASASVKEELGDTPVTKLDPDIPPPPPNLIIKEDVDDDKSRIHVSNDSSDEPCTKMTMRLRRNLSNTQFVSLSEHIVCFTWYFKDFSRGLLNWAMQPTSNALTTSW